MSTYLFAIYPHGAGEEPRPSGMLRKPPASDTLPPLLCRIQRMLNKSQEKQRRFDVYTVKKAILMVAMA